MARGGYYADLYQKQLLEGKRARTGMSNITKKKR